MPSDTLMITTFMITTFLSTAKRIAHISLKELGSTSREYLDRDKFYAQYNIQYDPYVIVHH